MTISSEALNYLTAGIQAEIAAYVFYRTGLTKLDREEMKVTMRHFANEERKHFLTLEHQYDQHVRSEKWVTYRDIMNQDGLPVVDESMGEKHVNRLARLDAAQSTMDILKLALELEQEAYDLYSEAGRKVENPEVRKTFEYLTNFELGHIRQVEEMMAEVGKQGDVGV